MRETDIIDPRIFHNLTENICKILLYWDTKFNETKGPILWEKLVHLQTVLKSNCSFNWLGKIVNSSINKTLNYFNLDRFTSVHITDPQTDWKSHIIKTVRDKAGTEWNIFQHKTFAMMHKISLKNLKKQQKVISGLLSVCW